VEVAAAAAAQRSLWSTVSNAECLTIGVRKRSQGNNGYLISTRWQKNFWLLA